MGNMTVAVVFVVFLNAIMMFSSVAIADLNPDGMVCYSGEGSIIDNGMDSNVTSTDPTTGLPDSTASVSSSTSGLGTDLFSSILGWMKSVPGLNVLIAVTTAPVNILKCMGVPGMFATICGVLWYNISLFIVLGYLWWRD